MKNNRTFVIINDVGDQNGKGRQKGRFHSISGQLPIFVWIKNDIEAGFNLIDQFAALKGKPGGFICQSAPRTDSTNGTNGTQFCYFWIGTSVFVTSVNGYILSLVKKLGLVKSVNVIKSHEAVTQLGLGDEEDSQFRSLEWLAEFLLNSLLKGKDLPHVTLDIDEIDNLPKCVVHVDKWKKHKKWGNCKLSVTENEIPISGYLSVKGKKIKIYNRLKDVPEGKLGVVVGSSGLKGRRFLEVVVGNGNAARKLRLKVGSKI
ncbi:MAG: SAM-dependent chlorinase/fluorinase [bacterium]|nr:SAM-dependent chlorinase/fluorinase [bacterium]